MASVRRQRSSSTLTAVAAEHGKHVFLAFFLNRVLESGCHERASCLSITRSFCWPKKIQVAYHRHPHHRAAKSRILVAKPYVRHCNHMSGNALEFKGIPTNPLQEDARVQALCGVVASSLRVKSSRRIQGSKRELNGHTSGGKRKTN